MMKFLLLTILLTQLSSSFSILNRLNRAHIVVDKRTSAPDTKEYIVIGHDFKVVYTISNLGSATAYDVTIQDIFPSKDFILKDGEASFHFAEIAAGSNMTHSVTLEPRISGVMVVSRANVDYKYADPEPVDDELDSDAPLLLTAHSLSSTLGKVEILKVNKYLRAVQSRELPASIALAAALFLTFYPYACYTAVTADNKNSD